jgi:hypothetical protein
MVGRIKLDFLHVQFRALRDLELEQLSGGVAKRAGSPPGRERARERKKERKRERVCVRAMGVVGEICGGMV